MPPAIEKKALLLGAERMVIVDLQENFCRAARVQSRAMLCHLRRPLPLEHLAIPPCNSGRGGGGGGGAQGRATLKINVQFPPRGGCLYRG